MIKCEAFNISHQRISAVISNAGLLLIVKISRLLDIFGGLDEDNNPSHTVRLARRFLSWVMVRNSALPDSILASLLASTFLCQAGDSSLSGSAESERQSSSMACSRSAIVMRSISTASITAAKCHRGNAASRSDDAPQLKQLLNKGLGRMLRPSTAHGGSGIIDRTH
jgi:hypothetical protein